MDGFTPSPGIAFAFPAPNPEARSSRFRTYGKRRTRNQAA